MNSSTTSREFFDAKYQDDEDPWLFASSAYELGRYNRIVAALGDRRFRRAFEPGCSIGVLTERLAPRCGEVLSIDISPMACEAARRRCKDLRNVHIREGSLPADIPEGNFDLIVFSEIGYYLDREALAGVIGRLANKMEESGLFLAVHWLGTSSDHVLSGDEVHDVISRTLGYPASMSDRCAGFRMDSWVCR